MRSFLLASALVVLQTSALFAGETPPAKQAVKFKASIVVDDVKPHIEYLASEELRGRSGPDARVAGEYIRKHFQQHGLEPLFDDGQSFYQDLPTRDPKTGETVIAGKNIGGVLVGSDPKLKDEYIILSAHYDHLGVRSGRMYRGADDNSSGVSMLLSVSKKLHESRFQPKRSIVFLAFDLEERMLWGSRWFVNHTPWPLENVKFFLTADMIGRSLGNLPLPTVFVMGSEHAPVIKSALDAVGTPEGLEASRLGIDLIGSIPRSDYGPFRSRKIPFLFFSTGEHPDYHTPNDLPERIDFEKVARVSSLILRLAKNVATSSETPAWTDELQPDIDEAKALHQICRLLTIAADGKQYKLTDVQRLVVTQAINKTKRIIARGKMSASERNELISVSQLLLLSVF